MRASDVVKRRWALVPLLFVLAAYILSMLCIFAGSSKGYLPEADLFTVSGFVDTPFLLELTWTQLNTSMLGRTTLDTSKTSSSILKSIKNTVQKDVNEAISDVAKTLGIHDFYSAHILDYCEVCPILSCSLFNRKTHIDSTITTGLLHSIPHCQSNLPALQKHHPLLQRNLFLSL